MRDEFQVCAESLLWSVWSELGVPGSGRNHSSVVLDPEPIIAFTPLLAQHDPRLLGLAFDWCTQNAKHISPSRLAGLGRMLSIPARHLLEGFNGALTAKGVQWRPKGPPAPLEQHRKTMAMPTDRDALLIFRIRALAGVSSRADVLCRMLFSPATGATTAQLTPCGTTRRAVEDVVNELTDSGLVAVHGSPRKRVFALNDRATFSRMVRSDGLVWWDWWSVLRLIAQLQTIPVIRELSTRLAHIEAVKLREACTPIAADLGMALPPRSPSSVDSMDEMAAWGRDVAGKLAEGKRGRAAAD